MLLLFAGLGQLLQFISGTGPIDPRVLFERFFPPHDIRPGMDPFSPITETLARLTEVVAFLTVHTGPASKILPDGRNAHINQQPMEWWLPKLTQRFELQTIQATHANAFYVIGFPKVRLEAPDGTKLVA